LKGCQLVAEPVRSVVLLTRDDRSKELELIVLHHGSSVPRRQARPPQVLSTEA
jgi:hypothetical protein